MEQKIDYLAIERKDQPEGSYYAAIKKLVVATRSVQTDIPATEIKQHMPSLYALEKEIHRIEDIFGDSRQQHVQQVWDTLMNEPLPDDTKYFAVCQMIVNDDNEEVTLTDTGYSFPQHVIAEEWIRKKASKGKQYVILEVIEPE